MFPPFQHIQTISWMDSYLYVNIYIYMYEYVYIYIYTYLYTPTYGIIFNTCEKRISNMIHVWNTDMSAYEFLIHNYRKPEGILESNYLKYSCRDSNIPATSDHPQRIGGKWGKPYIESENLWFPVGFPFNQPIDRSLRLVTISTSMYTAYINP